MKSQDKSQVRNFYDSVGWKLEADNFYQNARYEDLRPVSSEYIHRCHLRVNRHLRRKGRFLLDAGSGPVQYPEYLTYSAEYDYRVCADISILALLEARKRLGNKGLYVVADVSYLPFKTDTFDSVVSLHTLHHLPKDDQKRAYRDIFRVMMPGAAAVIVNGWPTSIFMNRMSRLVGLMERFMGMFKHEQKVETPVPAKDSEMVSSTPAVTGTFTERMDAATIQAELPELTIDIRVWRSVSVRFLRAVIHPWLGGKLWLKLIYQLEERDPHHYGLIGQYPMILFEKPKGSTS